MLNKFVTVPTVDASLTQPHKCCRFCAGGSGATEGVYVPRRDSNIV
jgi:hypothetical protein